MRIRIEGIRSHPWFQKNYVAVQQGEDGEVNLDDIRAVFDDIKDQYVTEQLTNNDGGPLTMNAFEMITLSQGLNLSALFDKHQEQWDSRSIRVITGLEGISANKAGQFAVVLEVFEVAPSLFMVDVRKAAGDTLEYHKFYKNLCAKLENIIWKPKEGSKSALYRTVTC